MCPKLKNLLLQSERKVEVQLGCDSGCDAENRLFAKAFVHSEKPENLVGSYFGAATFVSTTCIRKTCDDDNRELRSSQESKSIVIIANLIQVLAERVSL